MGRLIDDGACDLVTVSRSRQSGRPRTGAGNDQEAGPEVTTQSSVLAAARRAGQAPSAASRASWAAGVFAAKATITISGGTRSSVRVYLRDENRPLLERFTDAVGFGNIRAITRGGQETGTYGWDSGDQQQVAGMLYAFEPWLAGQTHAKAAAALGLLIGHLTDLADQTRDPAKAAALRKVIDPMARSRRPPA
jgi:hypothetical protein